jgi:hypothetical protein
MSYENNLKTLRQVNDLLGDLSQEIVYVGGITTFLYVDVAIADDIRPTKDVDFVLESANKKDYDQFQKKLRDIGFTHDMTKGSPICRFRYGEDLIIDAMPSDEKILGFSNSWYKEGIKHKEKVKIGKKEIYIFTLPYFLASKFEAFNGRGKSDPRMSWDLEDIILIIDGIKDFQIPTLSKKLKTFLSEMSTLCVINKNIQEAISGFLKHNPQKLNKVNERLKSLI